jgi:hypothetical protein
MPSSQHVERLLFFQSLGQSSELFTRAALILSLASFNPKSAQASSDNQASPGVFSSKADSAASILSNDLDTKLIVTPVNADPLLTVSGAELLNALRHHPTAAAIHSACNTLRSSSDVVLRSNVRNAIVECLSQSDSREIVLAELAKAPVPEFDLPLAKEIHNMSLENPDAVIKVLRAASNSGARACFDSLSSRLNGITEFPTLVTWNKVYPEIVTTLFALNPIDAPTTMMFFHLPSPGEIPDTTRFRYTFFTPERNSAIQAGLADLNADRYLALRSYCLPSSWTDLPFGALNMGLAQIYSPEYKEKLFPKFMRQVIDNYILLDTPVACVKIMQNAAVPNYLDFATNGSAIRERAIRKPLEMAPWLVGPRGLSDPTCIKPQEINTPLNSPFLPVNYYNIYWDPVVKTALGINPVSPDDARALIEQRRQSRLELLDAINVRLKQTKGIDIGATNSFNSAKADSNAFVTAKDLSTYPFRAENFGIGSFELQQCHSDSSLTLLAPFANYVTCAIDEALKPQIQNNEARRGTASLVAIDVFRDLALTLYAEDCAKRSHGISRADIRPQNAFEHLRSLLSDPVVAQGIVVSRKQDIAPSDTTAAEVRDRIFSATSAKLVRREYDLSRGVYLESLELNFDGAEKQLVDWIGQIPMALIGPLESNPRLLDLTQTSLCLRELNLERRPIPHRDILDSVLLDPLNAIAILALEAARDDIKEHWVTDALAVHGENAAIERLPRLPLKKVMSDQIIDGRRDPYYRVDLLGQSRGSLEIGPREKLGSDPYSNGITYGEFVLINRFYIDKTKGPVSSLPDDYTHWNIPAYIHNEHNDAKFAFLDALGKREKEVAKWQPTAEPWNLDPLRDGLQNLSLVRSGVNPEMDVFYSVYEVHTVSHQVRYGIVRGTMNIDPSLKSRITSIGLDDFWDRYRPDYAIAAGMDANAYISAALEREESLRQGALDNSLRALIASHAFTSSDLLAIQEARIDANAQSTAKTYLRYKPDELGAISDVLSGSDLINRLMLDRGGQARIASILLSEWETLVRRCDDHASKMAAPVLDAIQHSSNSNVFDGIFGAGGIKF